MSVCLAIAYLFLVLIVIDRAIRISFNHSLQVPNFKPAGLIAYFFLCLNRGPAKIDNKSYELKRVFVSFLMVCVLIGTSIVFIVNFNFKSAKPLFLLLWLLPLLIMPFYYVWYALNSDNPLFIHAALNNFQLRMVRSLVLSANFIFATYLDTNMGYLIHGIIIFMCLISCFYQISVIRLRPDMRDVNLLEDKGYNLWGLLYYIVSVGEIIYILLIFVENFLLRHLTHVYEIKHFFLIVFVISIGLVFILSVACRILFYKKSPWSLSFFEDRLLPISFLLFGAHYLFFAM